jgi:hypothetical protein
MFGHGGLNRVRGIVAIIAASITVVACGFGGAAVWPHSARAQSNPPDFVRDFQALIGVWRITTDSHMPDGKMGIMSIQPDGHIAIAVSGRQAADNDVKIIAGRYRLVSGGGGAGAIVVTVDDANIDEMIGKEFRLDLKIHGKDRFATGTADDAPFQLNKIWRRLGAE